MDSVHKRKANMCWSEWGLKSFIITKFSVTLETSWETPFGHEFFISVIPRNLQKVQIGILQSKQVTSKCAKMLLTLSQFQSPFSKPCFITDKPEPLALFGKELLRMCPDTLRLPGINTINFFCQNWFLTLRKNLINHYCAWDKPAASKDFK